MTKRVFYDSVKVACFGLSVSILVLLLLSIYKQEAIVNPLFIMGITVGNFCYGSFCFSKGTKLVLWLVGAAVMWISGIFCLFVQ
ncbi:hypothetical protein NIE88_19830 [Sporolactobacillus shoreicorticis]|uniref:Uncharacterized protein n=1 Tax=Sporolactobacillus shoreicorticis TaxID=1923877 RepID=A0ABW5S2N4_9BACL|nr:hypothetical protein [Sporolactobacillus shoreicorticis]MCO7127995.1 hypothetical protein [Sporolactobacillus shoreicorticis]